MTKWLKCHVLKGMFSDERTIIVRRKPNGTVEFFVPQSAVRGEGDAGRVEVTIIEREGAKWAVLPTPYKESIPVEEDELIPA